MRKFNMYGTKSGSKWDTGNLSKLIVLGSLQVSVSILLTACVMDAPDPLLLYCNQMNGKYESRPHPTVESAFTGYCAFTESYGCYSSQYREGTCALPEMNVPTSPLLSHPTVILPILPTAEVIEFDQEAPIEDKYSVIIKRAATGGTLVIRMSPITEAFLNVLDAYNKNDIDTLMQLLNAYVQPGDEFVTLGPPYLSGPRPLQQTPDPTANVQATAITLLSAWDIMQAYAHSWSHDAALLILNSADVDDSDQEPRTDGTRRVWQAVYSSQSQDKELHLQVVDGIVTTATEDAVYDPGIPSMTERPQVDSLAALNAVQAAIPDFGFSVGRGKGFHFGLNPDADGRPVIRVVGSSNAPDGSRVPTSVTVDPITGQVIEKQVLPK